MFKQHRGTGRAGAKDQYSSMAERWDKEWEGNVGSAESDIRKSEYWRWLGPALKPPARVLEAGCGYAHWVRSFDELGFDAHGIDFSPRAIELSLKRWPHLKLCRGDLRRMPYPDDCFDGMVSFGAVEHDENGPTAALTDMHRVLKPGGFLFCTVPCINRIRALGVLHLKERVVCNPLIRRLTGRRPEVQFYQYLFTPCEYEQILRKAGFDVLEIAPQSPYISGWQKKLRLQRLTKWAHRIDPLINGHMMAGVCRKPG